MPLTHTQTSSAYILSYFVTELEVLHFFLFSHTIDIIKGDVAFSYYLRYIYAIYYVYKRWHPNYVICSSLMRSRCMICVCGENACSVIGINCIVYSLYRSPKECAFIVWKVHTRDLVYLKLEYIFLELYGFSWRKMCILFITFYCANCLYSQYKYYQVSGFLLYRSSQWNDFEFQCNGLSILNNECPIQIKDFVTILQLKKV